MEFVGEDFDGVVDEEIGLGERVYDVEDLDEEDYGFVGIGGLFGVLESRVDGLEDKGVEYVIGGG